MWDVLKQLTPKLLFALLLCVVIALAGLLIYSVKQGNEVHFDWTKGITIVPTGRSQTATEILESLKSDPESIAAVESWANRHNLFCVEPTDFKDLLDQIAKFPDQYKDVLDTGGKMKGSVHPIIVTVTVCWAASVPDTDLVFNQGEKVFAENMNKPCQFPDGDLTIRVISTAILKVGWVQISECNFVKMLAKERNVPLPIKNSSQWHTLTAVGLLTKQELALNVVP
jgi:hypothetical protein